MNRLWKALLPILLLQAWPAFSADLLRWNQASGRVEAQVQSWTIPEVLERVAGESGWQIFIDPEITNSVRVRFKDQPVGDALRQILGDLNYALVPNATGPAKLLVFKNSKDLATRAIKPLAPDKKKAKASPIGNELIVTLKPGEKIEDVAKRLGAKIVGRADGQNTYRLRFDEDKAAESARSSLQNDPAVEAIDSNYYVSRPEGAQPTGGAGGPLSLTPKASPDGKYTVVGLIDSAVQAKESNLSDFLLPAINVNGETKPTENSPSHGTSMGETILRGLSNYSSDSSTTVRLLPVDVYGGSETATTYDIAVGIYKAVNNGAMIVNLSLGGDGDSSFLHNTIKSAYDQGVVFIGAAGNEPTTNPTYPAAYPEVIAITAADRNGELASYANRGSFVDGMAPGGGLVTFNGKQYYVVGTSTATAYVSGRAAALAESTKALGRALETAILQPTATAKPQ